MDKLEKAYRKFTRDQQDIVDDIYRRLYSGDLYGLNVKKLRGYDNTYRVRKSRVRIVYSLDKNKKVTIKKIDLKDDSTYENL